MADSPRTVHGAWRQLDEFLRIYQVGFVAVWPLLGLACAGAWTWRSVVALVAVSVCFNVAGSILNDIVDLPSDRQSPERRDRWLVVGTVSIVWAWAIVLSQIPIMLAIHFAAGFRLPSAGWLAAMVIGQALYDCFGKRSRIPPLAEAGEAIAAGSLVIYGATCTASVIPPLAWPTAAAGAAMVMVANAFHGGLRDIGDDLRSRVQTTPIWLGCSTNGGQVQIAPAMSAYTAGWLAVLLASSMLVAFDGSTLTQFATAAGCALNVGLFLALHYLKTCAWSIALRVHVAVLAVPIMTAFTATLGAWASVALFAIYVGPVLPLTYTWLQHVVRQFQSSFRARQFIDS